MRPRQRRKKDSSQSGLVHSYQQSGGPDYDEWQDGTVAEISESDCFSPVDGKFDALSPMNFSTTSDNPLSPIDGSSTIYDYGIDDDEDHPSFLVRRNSSISVVSQARSLQPDLAMIAPCPVGSPTLEFVLPVFSEFSERPNRRALVDHFCNVLSHLIVFREESGNPFQQLVLPLSHRSSPIMNAIYALASAHMEYRGVETAEKSMYFHNRAIQGLARLIEQEDKVDKIELLAAIMLLVYYEVVSFSRNSICGLLLLTNFPACPTRTV